MIGAISFPGKKRYVPLTTEEHALLIALFTKQQQSITVLIEILKSREILTQDDVSAFRALVATDSVASLRELRDVYVGLAKKLGLEIPAEIETLGPSRPRSQVPE